MDASNPHGSFGFSVNKDKVAEHLELIVAGIKSGMIVVKEWGYAISNTDDDFRLDTVTLVMAQKVEERS